MTLFLLQFISVGSQMLLCLQSPLSDIFIWKEWFSWSKLFSMKAVPLYLILSLFLPTGSVSMTFACSWPAVRRVALRGKMTRVKHSPSNSEFSPASWTSSTSWPCRMKRSKKCDPQLYSLLWRMRTRVSWGWQSFVSVSGGGLSSGSVWLKRRVSSCIFWVLSEALDKVDNPALIQDMFSIVCQLCSVFWVLSHILDKVDELVMMQDMFSIVWCLQHPQACLSHTGQGSSDAGRV